jgi:hypothetical protein
MTTFAAMRNDAETELSTATLPASCRNLTRALVNLPDCGRLVRDIVAGMLCGATVGLFVAMLGASF